MNHRFPRLVLIVVPALLAASSLAQDAVSEKKPAPDAAAQAQATKLVKEVYGDDYAKAKTSDQKVALAKKLFQTAGETRNDPDALYALLNVAKDMAILAANADTAFAAIDALAQSFEVNPLELKAEALIAASKRARLPAEHGSIANLALAVLEGAIATDRYDLATQFGELGLAEARLAPKSEMIQPILARLREIGDLATAYESTRKAATILEKTPTDPDASLTVGKYLCLVKGDWDKGISYLALGTDEKLRALAVKELEGTTGTDGQVALGDGWWDLGSANEGIAQKQLQGRAAYWYKKALPGLTGLVKDKVEKRLGRTAPSADSQSPVQEKAVAPKPVDLLPKVRIPTNVLKGKWIMRPDGLVGEDGSIHLPTRVHGDYDLHIEFTRRDQKNDTPMTIALPVGPTTAQFFLNMFGRRTGLATIDSADPRYNKTGMESVNIVPGKRHSLDLSVRLVDAEIATIAATFDGRDCFQWKGRHAELKTSPYWNFPTDGSFAFGFVGTAGIHTVRLTSKK